MREAEGGRKNAPSIGKSSNSSSSSSAVAGFCGSLDPEDEDGSASTDFAVEPEPSGAAAISESGGFKWALGGGDAYFAVAGPVAGRVVGWRVRLDAERGNRLNNLGLTSMIVAQD